MTMPHARTPQPILDTIEAVLRGKPLGLAPSTIEILVARRLGPALPKDIQLPAVIEDLVATGRGEWVSSRGSWRMRLFADGEIAPELPAGTKEYEALDHSPLSDREYVNAFAYRQIDVLADGRILISAVNLTRISAAQQALNWLHDNQMVKESRVERNLGRGKWGVTDIWSRTGRENTTRHHDVVAAQLRAQRQTREVGDSGADLG